MEIKIKKNFDIANELSYGIPSYALAGASGSGKTTFALECINVYSAQFLYANIGAIQSSKIRLSLVPLFMDETEAQNSCLRISFMDYPNVDLVMKVLNEAVTDRIVKAGDNIDEEDIEEIVEELLTPKNRIYDLSAYCTDELRARLVEAVDLIVNWIIEENDEHTGLMNAIKAQKTKIESSGNKFNKKEGLKREVDTRLSNIGASQHKVHETLPDLFSNLKNSIINKVNELVDKGLDVVFDKNDIVVYIDSESAAVANELFKFLFVKDGKDIVVSHLTYLAPMSSLVEKEFKYVRRGSKPLFKLYDLKGLEAGENSIDESLIKIRESLPDAVLAFQKTNNISDYFVKFLNAVQTEFAKVPVRVILTHADESVKAHLRNMLKAFGAVAPDAPGYEKFRAEKILEAYDAVEAECKCYADAIRNNKSNENDPIICSLLNECSDIDAVLGDKALYKPERLINLIGSMCREKIYSYDVLSDEIFDSEVISSISISFDQAKLNELASRFAALHKQNAQRQYLNQATRNPHWNSVYKWRAMHRVGCGWESSAKVYDNIKIHIADNISEIMSRDDIINAMVIDVPNGSDEERKRIVAALNNNIQYDMGVYNGFYTRLKRILSFDSFSAEFNGTYFSDALWCIYHKLTDEQYIKEAMNTALNDYSSILKDRTFE